MTSDAFPRLLLLAGATAYLAGLVVLGLLVVGWWALLPGLLGPPLAYMLAFNISPDTSKVVGVAEHRAEQGERVEVKVGGEETFRRLRPR